MSNASIHVGVFNIEPYDSILRAIDIAYKGH